VQPGKASVTALFSAPAQYLIPVFQRGYVWTLDKQVAPLWADLEDRALKLTERNDRAQQVGSHPLKALQKHFLGSLVLTPVTSAFGRVTAYEVHPFNPFYVNTLESHESYACTVYWESVDDVSAELLTIQRTRFERDGVTIVTGVKKLSANGSALV